VSLVTGAAEAFGEPPAVRASRVLFRHRRHSLPAARAAWKAHRCEWRAAQRTAGAAGLSIDGSQQNRPGLAVLYPGSRGQVPVQAPGGSLPIHWLLRPRPQDLIGPAAASLSLPARPERRRRSGCDGVRAKVGPGDSGLLRVQSLVRDQRITAVRRARRVHRSRSAKRRKPGRLPSRP